MTTQEDKAMIASAFDKVATFLVEHSEQAERLAKVEAQVSELRTTLQSYRVDNSNLRQDLWKAQQERNAFERELGEARTASETMGRRNHELREDNVAKSNEIESLKAEVQQLTQALGRAETTTSYLRGLVATQDDDLKRQVAKADEYFAEAVKYEEAAKAAEASLAKVREALGLVGQEVVKPMDPMPVPPASAASEGGLEVSGTTRDPAYAPLPHEAWPKPEPKSEASQSGAPLTHPFEGSQSSPRDEQF